MSDLQVQVGKLRPTEVELEDKLNILVDDFAGRITTAELIGVMLQVWLVRLGALDD